MGIGRPSTYASIIDTILARDYVFKLKRGNVLVPTWTAFAVSHLLESHLPELVDYQFTAEMEDELDAISRGEMNHLDYLRQFYFGNEHPGLKQLLQDKVNEIDARDVCRISLGKPDAGQVANLPGDDQRAGEIFVRVGRYGPFLEQGERRASLPERLPPDELTLPAALEMLDKAGQGDEPLGLCPDTHKPVFVKVGRFGPYVQRGTAEDDEKPQNASLAQGHGTGARDVGDGAAAVVAAAHAGRASADPRAGGGPQRPLRPLCQVRRGDPLACPTDYRLWMSPWSKRSSCSRSPSRGGARPPAGSRPKSSIRRRLRVSRCGSCRVAMAPM